MKQIVIRALAVVLAIGAAVFVGRATAGPGTAGGASTSVLVWQGTLTGATTSTPFKFEFKKAGSVVCTVNTVPTKVVGDAVTVNVDYLGGTGSGSSCRDLFDGADVNFTVTAAGASLTDQPIGTVGYAKYADRSSRVAVTSGGSTVSASAKFCGATTETVVGDFGVRLGGYAEAKRRCEKACASSTAHMCSPPEMVRSVELGLSIPAAPGGTYLVSSGAFSAVGSGGADDCHGWQSKASTSSAASWNNDNSPGYVSCNIAYKIACCD